MNEILKQRLVGALILIALGVVFWPIIFVEPGDISSGEARRIPARPAVNTEPIAAPEKESLRQSQELESRKEAERRDIARETAAAPEVVSKPTPQSEPVAKNVAAKAKTSAEKTHQTRTKAPPKPAIDAEGVPIAWILQVASVGAPEKAEELRTRLLEMGYKAYVKKVHRSGKVLLRVYIGPKFERAKLENIKAGIDAEFGVQSIVVRYIP